MHETTTQEVLASVGPSARALLAVSGGPDSLAMTHWFASRAEWQSRVVIAHVNHGLTPEADTAALLCRRAAAELAVPFAAERVEVEKERLRTGESVESCARRLRYAALEHMSAEQHCDLVVTAHTLDDDAETVFMRLMQGSSWFECTGIPVRRERILRPFLHWPRQKLRGLLPAGVAVYEDPMNMDIRFPRVRARVQLSRIQKRHPEVVSQLAEFGQQVARSTQISKQLLKSFINNNLTYNARLSSKLVILPNNLYLEDLDFLFAESVLEIVSTGQISRISGPIRRQVNSFLNGVSPEAEFSLTSTWQIKRAGEQRWLEHADTRKDPGLAEPRILSTSTVYVPSAIQGVTRGLIEVDAVRVRGTIGLRAWHAGERFKPTQRRTRKIADWLRDYGVHPGLRRLWPVITDDDGIIAIPGLGIADRVAPLPNSTPLRIAWQSDTTRHE